MSQDMPVFLTPYFLVEGTVAEIVDCLAGVKVVGLDDGRMLSYRGAIGEAGINAMYAAIYIYAIYGIAPLIDQLIGWLRIERIRAQCHLEMQAPPEHKQLACDVLLSLPNTLEYLGSVNQTMLRPHEVLRSSKKSEELHNRLPPVTDPIDQHILQIALNDPDLTDEQIGHIVNLSRGRVNERRNRLARMGYKVR